MADKQNVLPDNYDNWRKEVISLIESAYSGAYPFTFR